MNQVTLEKIIAILNEKINGIEITAENANEDLSKLGMDSLTFISIIVSIEEFFHCEIPDSKLIISEMNTANKIYKVLCDEYT